MHRHRDHLAILVEGLEKTAKFLTYVLGLKRHLWAFRVREDSKEVGDAAGKQ